MIGLVVQQSDGTTSAFEFDPRNGRISFGSSPLCSVVVEGARKLHADITGNDVDGYRVRTHAGWFATTKLNGHRIAKESVMPLSSGDELTIANTQIRFHVIVPRSYVASDRDEAKLLAQIAGGDDGARLVYGDWLEQRGERDRAEFLRVQHDVMTQPQAPAFSQRVERLQELARDIDITWRRQVARQFVEGCTGFEAPCPNDWSKMEPTERSDVRHCSGCNKNVYYCETIDDARRRAVRGECVAVDAVLVRRPYDLGNQPDPGPHPFRLTGAMPMPRR